MNKQLLLILLAAGFVSAIVCAIILTQIEVEWPGISQANQSLPSAPIVAGPGVGQTFVAEHSNLERIDVALVGSRQVVTAPITFHLARIDKNNVVAPDAVQLSVPLASIQHSIFYTYAFALQPDSAGKTYVFYLTTTSSQPENTYHILSTDRDYYPAGSQVTVKDGTVTPAGAIKDAAFRVYYRGPLGVALLDILGTGSTGRPAPFNNGFVSLILLLMLPVILALALVVARQRLAGGKM
jgi:hypothetical protein